MALLVQGVLLCSMACIALGEPAVSKCLARDADPDPIAPALGVNLLQKNLRHHINPDDKLKSLLRPLVELLKGSPVPEWKQEQWQVGANVSLIQGSARRRCGHEACHGKSVAPSTSKQAKTYVFVMGVEGAGHHAVCPLLKMLLQKHGYEARTAPINMFGREKLLSMENWTSKFLAETQSWCPSGVCLNCLDSFPYERPIKASASPDFARMAALHEKGLIDLRVVAIMRNISDCVFSALRRFPSDAVQAVAFSRQFLTEVVRNTDAWSRSHCERLSTLRYENLVTKPESVVDGLVHALGLSVNGKPRSQMLSVAEVYKHDVVKGMHGREYRDDDPAMYDRVASWLNEREDFLWPELKELWCK